MSEFAPLCIEWKLSGYVVVPDRHPILLDALLLAANSKQISVPFSPSDLPLEHIQSEKKFFWLASVVEIEFVGPSCYRQTFRNAKPLQMLADAEHLHASSVSLERGITRTVKSTYLTRQAVAAKAWCLGDAKAINSLVESITHLGAKRHIATGQIVSWVVRHDKAAKVKSWLRPIPVTHVSDPYKDQRIQMQGPCTPPYWHKQPVPALWPMQICL